MFVLQGHWRASVMSVACLCTALFCVVVCCVQQPVTAITFLACFVDIAIEQVSVFVLRSAVGASTCCSVQTPLCCSVAIQKTNVFCILQCAGVGLVRLFPHCVRTSLWHKRPAVIAYDVWLEEHARLQCMCVSVAQPLCTCGAHGEMVIRRSFSWCARSAMRGPL